MKPFSLHGFRLAVITIVALFANMITPVYAQTGVKIAATAGTADPSAILELSATNKGLLFPRVDLVGLTNSTTPVNNPATGLVVYNTGNGGVSATGIYFWSGSAWVLLSSGGLSGSGTANYLARWTASNAVGIGVTQDDGTNVGIGVTPGTYKLNVQGGSLNVGTLYGGSVMYGTLGTFDTRATSPAPETYNMGVTSEFKSNAANGLNDGGAYNEVLTLRNWSSGTDWSGGGIHQLGFTGNGNMYHRYSETTGAWGQWFKLTDSRAVVFNCTGADQTWVCPAGVTSIEVKIWGAGGGAGSYGSWNCGYTGGGGGFSTGTIAVTPGQTYYIVVGQGGPSGVNSTFSEIYGGGGKSCTSSDCRYCGSGGGRSAFRNTSNSADLMTAGGGGGGGASNGSNNLKHRGGAGGGTTGQNGENQINVGAYYGGGGTQGAGGAGALGATRTGVAGTQYHGGYVTGTESYGGGGGGGWYGGGGGGYNTYMSGGGGGSGYISGAGVSGATTTAGSYDFPAGVTDPYYINGVAVGGRGGAGGDGRVVIILK